MDQVCSNILFQTLNLIHCATEHFSGIICFIVIKFKDILGQ